MAHFQGKTRPQMNFPTRKEWHSELTPTTNTTSETVVRSSRYLRAGDRRGARRSSAAQPAAGIIPSPVLVFSYRIMRRYRERHTSCLFTLMCRLPPSRRGAFTGVTVVGRVNLAHATHNRTRVIETCMPMNCVGFGVSNRPLNGRCDQNLPGLGDCISIDGEARCQWCLRLPCLGDRAT